MSATTALLDHDELASKVKLVDMPERHVRIPPFDTHVEQRPVEGTAADAELAELLHAIAHPERIQIIRYLSRRTTCVVTDLTREIAVDPQHAKRHLEALKRAGFVRGEIEGEISFYLDPARLRRLRTLISAL
jgi:ArsR family transcriptional regulator